MGHHHARGLTQEVCVGYHHARGADPVKSVRVIVGLHIVVEILHARAMLVVCVEVFVLCLLFV